MKNNLLKCSIASLAIGFGALSLPYNANAASAPAIDECAKELLLSYFPEPIVTDTLKKFNIPQEKWAGINQSLSTKDKEVVKIVEQKASAMNPNPLKDPQQRQAAVKLFRETLLKVFSDALNENGITDSSQFQAMLDDIQQYKAKKFAMCMEKQRAQMQSAQTPSPAPAVKSSSTTTETREVNTTHNDTDEDADDQSDDSDYDDEDEDSNEDDSSNQQ